MGLPPSTIATISPFSYRRPLPSEHLAFYRLPFGQAPLVNEEKAMVLHTSEEKSSQEDISEKKETDDEPPTKKLKLLIPPLLIPSPTPLKEPTPPRDESKGKGIDTEEPLKDTMPFMEEGGSVPKMPKTKSFTTSVGPLSQKEFNAQIKEMKRLADLKAEKEKPEQELRKILNQATLKA
ncbi:hypothetical protein Tco_0421139 [Tanacetum coccineum]